MRTQCRCILSSPRILPKGSSLLYFFIPVLCLTSIITIIRKRNLLLREEIRLIMTKMMKRACTTRPESWRKWNMNNRKTAGLTRWIITILAYMIKYINYVFASQGLGINVRSFVVVAVMMMLMMFAVHCTWVTSNAYSSPSIVLASYGQDG
jgi:hypothetical protein